jgi:hypothetical protein
MSFLTISEYFKAVDEMPMAKKEKEIAKVQAELNKRSKLTAKQLLQLRLMAIEKLSPVSLSTTKNKPLSLIQIDEIKHKVRKQHAK